MHHLEDVRMATDEERGRLMVKGAADGGIVVAWIASDVFDEYVCPLDGEALYLGIAQTDIAPIDIAIDGTEGAEGLKLLSHLERTYVACMPHLVALGEVPRVAFIPIAMGIRE